MLHFKRNLGYVHPLGGMMLTYQIPPSRIRRTPWRLIACCRKCFTFSSILCSSYEMNWINEWKSAHFEVEPNRERCSHHNQGPTTIGEWNNLHIHSLCSRWLRDHKSICFCWVFSSIRLIHCALFGIHWDRTAPKWAMQSDDNIGKKTILLVHKLFVILS